MREREGLIARIRQVRRAAAASDERARPSTTASDPDRVLERRVADLGELVQGLQDSVYRESLRQGELISKLHSRVQPAAIAAALSTDARERGL